MRKVELQQVLSRLADLDEPDPDLEQYPTPPDIAADVLHRIDLSDGLDGKQVVDLGCGNGILGLGAALCGASVTLVDVDSDAVATARANLSDLRTEYDLDVDIVEGDVRSTEVTADVAVMNPPFGMSREDANLDFLEAGFRAAPVVHALLHRSRSNRDYTRAFLGRFAERHGYTGAVVETYTFPLPRRFGFHTAEREDIGVDLYRFERG